MKSITLRTMLILSLTAPAFAGGPLQEHGTAAPAGVQANAVPCADKETGSLENLTARLQALTEPMEQKVEDCDGEVAKAKELLASLETRLAGETASIRKTHAEILLLKDALGQRGCELLVGGCKFRREVVAEGLEKRLHQYQQIAVSVKELRNNVAVQKEAVQAAIAKLERWQAKEKELLLSVELLQKSHEELFGSDDKAVDRDVLQQAAQVEAEVESMLGLNIESRVANKPAVVVAEEVELLDDANVETTKGPVEEAQASSIPTITNSAKAVSNPQVVDVEVDSEIEVDVEIETEVEVDAEFDLGILDEIFEKP